MNRRLFPLALLAAVALLWLSGCEETVYQGDFAVSAATKSTHPETGTGYPVGYVIDGVEGQELTLTRGVTYSFAVNAPGHPFYLTTSAVGGPGYPGEITVGVSGSRVQSGILTFTPDASHANLIYYQCGAHLNMGWKINIAG